MGPGLGSTRDERHSFLLRNAHVDIVLAQCLATLLRQATHGWYGTLNDEKFVVKLSFLHQVLSEQVGEAFTTADVFGFPVFKSKGTLQCQASLSFTAG